MDSMPNMYYDFEMLKQEILGWELLEKSKIHFFKEKFCFSTLCKKIVSNIIYFVGGER